LKESRNISQKLKNRRKRLLDVVEKEFDSYADFCRQMELSHNWVNYFKSEDEPPKISDRLLSSLYEAKNVNPLWVISGEGERKIYPEQPRKNRAAEPEERYIAQFKQVSRLIDSIAQKPDSIKDASLLGDLALESAELTTSLLELQQQARNDEDE